MITLKHHCNKIASKGGSVRSERKTIAARLNARKPRPKARKENKMPVEVTDTTHSTMLSQIASFVEEFAKTTEDTTLQCVLNLLEEYYLLKAESIRRSIAQIERS